MTLVITWAALALLVQPVTASNPPEQPPPLPPPPRGLHLSGESAELKFGLNRECTIEYRPGPPPYLELGCPIQAPLQSPSPPPSPPPPSPRHPRRHRGKCGTVSATLTAKFHSLAPDACEPHRAVPCRRSFRLPHAQPAAPDALPAPRRAASNCPRCVDPRPRGLHGMASASSAPPTPTSAAAAADQQRYENPINLKGVPPARAWPPVG